MDFPTAKDTALSYVKKGGSDLVIAKTDEKQSAIHLSSLNGGFKFCISCPSKDNPCWALWSDQTKSQSVIQDVMDRVDLESVKDITQILDVLCDITKKTSCKTATSVTREKDDNSDECEDDEDDDDDDDYDDYYAEEDTDAQREVVKKKDDDSPVASNFFNSTGSPVAVSRLVKDLKMMTESHKFGIVGTPVLNNLFVWDVKLTNIPSDTKLGKDLKDYQLRFKEEAAIQLSVQFPSDYPYSPPFIRVIKPRFKFLTGHVTIGGSICMEMLTRSGWCPTNDIESILVQVRTEILSDPKASLDPCRAHVAYSEEEARTAFQRMVQKYGWS